MPSLPEFRAVFSLATHRPVRALLEGHGGVRSLALSHDRQWLATGADDGHVAIHSTEILHDRAMTDSRPQVLDPIQVGSEWVRAIAIAPAGDWWVAGSNDGSMRVFRWVVATQTWETCQLIDHAHGFWVMAVKISPDGKTVISAGADNRVRAWRVELHEGDISLTPLWTGDRHSFWVSCLAIAPDGQRVFSAGYDGAVVVWELATGKVLHQWEAHGAQIASLAIAPDGRTLATGAADRLIYLWDPDTGTQRATLAGNGSNVFALEFHPDGHTLYSGGGDGTVRAWNGESGEFIHFVAGSANCIWSMAIAPNGEWLAVAGVDCYVRRWSLPDRRDLGVIGTDGEQFPGMAIAPNSQTLWLGGNHGDLRAIAMAPSPTAVTFAAINATTGNCDGRVRALAFGAQPHDFWTGGDDGFIRHWQLDPKSTAIATAPSSPVEPQAKAINAWHTNTLWVMAIAHSHNPDAPWIASGGTDQIVTLWAPDGKPLQHLKGHTGWIGALAIAPHDAWLVSASHDGTLRQWETRSGRCIRTLTPPRHNLLEAVAIDAAGHWITGAGDGHIWLWNAHTGHLSATIKQSNRVITHLHFAPDSPHLVASCLDQRVCWWNLHTLECDRCIVTQAPPITTQTLPGNHLITTPAWGGHLECFSSGGGL